MAEVTAGGNDATEEERTSQWCRRPPRGQQRLHEEVTPGRIPRDREGPVTQQSGADAAQGTGKANPGVLTQVPVAECESRRVS